MMTFAQQENIGFRYVINKLECSSPYGQARVNRLRFFDADETEELELQLRNICAVRDTLAELSFHYGRLERLMMPMKDIRRSVMNLEEAQLSELELFELKRFLLQTELIYPVLEEVKAKAHIQGIDIPAQTEALKLMDPEGNRAATFFISDNASGELKAARRLKKELEEKLRRENDPDARAKLTAERSLAAGREDAEERRIRKELCIKLMPYKNGILSCMDNVAELDFTIARAKLAEAYSGVMPKFSDGAVMMEDMINPRVADALFERDRRFTPVSLEAPVGATVITGANMGGKSVALKTLALNAMLVKAGMLPFAKKAKLPLFGGIFIVSEDLEDIDRGLSSFGAEIVQFNETIAQAAETKGISLILLDEFARGTNPEEGAMIVRAVTRYLDRQRSVSVLTTHYDGVAGLASAHFEVKGLKDMDMEAVAREIAASSGSKKGADIIASHMNYGLYRAQGDESCPRDARNICALLSLKDEILNDI